MPIGPLPQVLVKVEGIWTHAYFEVIDIVYDMNPYPKILDINWDIENHTIIKFKKNNLSF